MFPTDLSPLFRPSPLSPKRGEGFFLCALPIGSGTERTRLIIQEDFCSQIASRFPADGKYKPYWNWLLASLLIAAVPAEGSFSGRYGIMPLGGLFFAAYFFLRS